VAVPAADDPIASGRPRPSPLLLAAIGLGAGVLSGLFGVGGGIIMVPAMVLAAGLPQQRASATSLAAIVPIAAVGALVFGRAESVDLVAAGVLVIGSLAGVQLGTLVMARLDDDRLRIGFAIFMVVVAVAMLLS
jgi:uncharacterized membrane protein YfcA